MLKNIIFLFTFCLGASPQEISNKPIHHYVFFDLERERISDESFLKTPQFEGTQLKYTWPELEPEKDKYDFNAIEKDLNFLNAHGKKLFIQIQDLSFTVSRKYVPKYLLNEAEFHGGASLHYSGEGEDAKPEGWIARRWDKAVRNRFQKLLKELGKQFDGRIAGINLPETAFSHGDKEDFTPSNYRDAIVETMKAMKSAFTKSVTMQYANFMPGEWLPHEDHGYLRDVYESASKLGVGVGGPDLLPFKKGQLNHAYRFIPEFSGKIPTGIATQWDNYKHLNPNTGKEVSVSELYGFAKNQLKVDFIFWCTQEPYFTRDLIPFLGKVVKSEN